MADNLSTTSISGCLTRAAELAHSDSPRLDVELLLAFVLGKTRTYLYTWPERELTGEQLTHFEQLLAARQQGRPIAHLIGEREFWGLALTVDDSTLIPRPDTETLVEVALGLSLPARARVVDLGTGTGAIALALASEQPGWQVTGVDVSAEAVSLAERNRDRLGLSNVALRVSHWFEQVEKTPCHLIVSNPPYIDELDPHLQLGDVRFEPLSALVADSEGMADLEHIIHTARDYLMSEGWLLLEHGYQQGEAVRQCLAAAGYRHVETRQDYGGNDRVSLGQWP